MTIRFSCDCGRQIKTKDEYAGKRIKCPDCGEVLIVPAAEEEDSAAVVAEAPRRPAGPRRAEPEDEPDREADEDQPRSKRGASRPAKTSGQAVASLILGLGAVLCFPTGMVAAILGLLALKNIRASNGRLKGSGLALVGIVIGTLLFVAEPIAGYLGIQRIRQAAARVTGQIKLRQLSLAVLMYQNEHGKLPSAVLREPGGQPYSWRVAILPYLEGGPQLYNRYNRKEPWDSPNNQAVLALMPQEFADLSAPGSTNTYFQVFVGPGAAFEEGKQLHLGDFTDGASNTLLIVEAGEAVPWTKPVDLPYAPNQPLPKIGLPGKDTFSAAFADGFVRTISKSIDEKTLRALITRNGNEPVNAATLP